jgi:hypothetical protein
MPTPSLESVKKRLTDRLNKRVGKLNENRMFCALYDPLTDKYFEGTSGDKDRKYDNIPSAIYSKIPNVYDAHSLIFGRGCAEVQAIDRMFAARGVGADTSLKNCVFAAKKQSDQVFRPLCNNCRKWLVDNPIAGKAIDAISTTLNVKDWYK